MTIVVVVAWAAGWVRLFARHSVDTERATEDGARHAAAGTDSLRSPLYRDAQTMVWCCGVVDAFRRGRVEDVLYEQVATNLRAAFYLHCIR